MTGQLFGRPAGAADYTRLATVHADAEGLATFHVEQKPPDPLSRTVRQHDDGHRVAGTEHRRRAEGRDRRPHHGRRPRRSPPATAQKVTARLVDGDNGRPLANQRVIIQERTVGQHVWQTFGRAITNNQGLAKFTGHMVRSSFLRVVFPSQATIGSSASAALRIDVTPVDAVRIALDRSSIHSGATAVVETRVVDAVDGQGLAHAPVTLWARTGGSDWAQVDTQAGTHGDGTAHWTVQPTETTSYEVRVDHVGARQPVVSTPITLTVT